jgi:hypothetical protein
LKAVDSPYSSGSAGVGEFQVFVTDDRYSVPTLYILDAASAARACELAEGIFAQSLHHLGVEVFDDGSCILTLGVVGTGRG